MMITPPMKMAPGSAAFDTGWDHPPGLFGQLPLDRSRFLPEYPQMAGIIGWGLCRDSESETAYEAHGEPNHQIVAGICLAGRAVAPCSMGGHW